MLFIRLVIVLMVAGLSLGARNRQTQDRLYDNSRYLSIQESVVADVSNALNQLWFAPVCEREIMKSVLETCYWVNAKYTPVGYEICKNFTSSEESGILRFPLGTTANKKCAFLINIPTKKWITFTCSNVDETSFASLKAYPTIASASTDESKSIGALPLPKSVAFKDSVYIEFIGNDKDARLDCKWSTSVERPNLLKFFG